MGKTMERMIKNRMTYYLESKGLLSNKQAGFRKARSTEEQIARTAQTLLDGLQEGKRSILCLVDFSKAYDRVWRTGLYKKMINMGIPNCMISWIKGFLTDRAARVRLGDAVSKTRIMKEGLPQGSVISPLLWLIYINDIGDRWNKVEESLFADDTALVTQAKNVEEAETAMQENIDRLQEWCEKWKVLVNASKCETMLVTLDPREVNRKKMDQHKVRERHDQPSHPGQIPRSNI